MAYITDPPDIQAPPWQIPTTDAEWRAFARNRTTEDMVFIGAAYAIQWGLKRDKEKTAQVSGYAYDSAEGLAERGEARSAQENQDETLSFLERLRPGGPWVLTAIVPDGPTVTTTARTEQEAAAFVRQHNGWRNLYYSVNPVRRVMDKKASKVDIAVIECVFADCDPREGETPDEGKNRILATRRTSALPIPTFVVDSGNGAATDLALGRANRTPARKRSRMGARGPVRRSAQQESARDAWRGLRHSKHRSHPAPTRLDQLAQCEERSGGPS